MLVNNQGWNSLKNSHKIDGFGSGIYIESKQDLDNLLSILNGRSKDFSSDFCEDRLLMVGKTSSKTQENRWQVLYSPLGMNSEASFFTTINDGELVNVINLPLSQELDVDKTLQEKIASGEKLVTPYEEEFVNDTIAYLEESKEKSKEL